MCFNNSRHYLALFNPTFVILLTLFSYILSFSCFIYFLIAHSQHDNFPDSSVFRDLPAEKLAVKFGNVEISKEPLTIFRHDLQIFATFLINFFFQLIVNLDTMPFYTKSWPQLRKTQNFYTLYFFARLGISPKVKPEYNFYSKVSVFLNYILDHIMI